MQLIDNPHRPAGLGPEAGLAAGRVRRDPAAALALLARCPVAATTPLWERPRLAHALGVGRLLLKDERGRMGLGSFKALGAAHAIAQEAERRAAGGPLTSALADQVYVCASAGNHGLSVAVGARTFGARAVIHLAASVPEAFAGRLRALGAEVVRSGDDYEAAMAAAAGAAEEHGWTLLSDSSWPGYTELPTRVMEGYLVVGDEVANELERPPSHVFLQAGVGGLAAALTALFRARWGDDPVIVVVEPEAAPALAESIRAGRPVATAGPASCMGRLDCKEPSHLALAELARGADWFVTIGEEEATAAVALLERHGLATTPSGAAGVAALQHLGRDRERLGLTADSTALVFVSEGREDPP
ncbi:MAG: pyridoxal-phosphate dependent enzyme [Halofilum sp. (in: g-proteobacteria)]|nr:pyridoxal-phosphate dependent enzyme [Halofilum sp. (in: g-proteobacteria)]